MGKTKNPRLKRKQNKRTTNVPPAAERLRKKVLDASERNGNIKEEIKIRRKEFLQSSCPTKRISRLSNT
jgi:hypothetical protein